MSKTEREKEREREKLFDTPIPVKYIMPEWALELDTRLISPIIKHGLQYIPHLDTMEKKDFLKIYQVGEKAADEIIRIREEYKTYKKENQTR